MTADFAACYDHLAISAPDSLVVHFREEYTLHKESCEQPERKAQLEQVLARLVGRPVRIRLGGDARRAANRQAAPPPDVPAVECGKRKPPAGAPGVPLV